MSQKGKIRLAECRSKDMHRQSHRISFSEPAQQWPSLNPARHRRNDFWPDTNLVLPRHNGSISSSGGACEASVSKDEAMAVSSMVRDGADAPPHHEGLVTQ